MFHVGLVWMYTSLSAHRLSGVHENGKREEEQFRRSTNERLLVSREKWFEINYHQHFYSLEPVLNMATRSVCTPAPNSNVKHIQHSSRKALWSSYQMSNSSKYASITEILSAPKQSSLKRTSLKFALHCLLWRWFSWTFFRIFRFTFNWIATQILRVKFLSWKIW